MRLSWQKIYPAPQPVPLRGARPGNAMGVSPWCGVYRIISLVFFAILMLFLIKNLILNILAYDKVKVEKNPWPTSVNSSKILPGPNIPQATFDK